MGKMPVVHIARCQIDWQQGEKAALRTLPERQLVYGSDLAKAEHVHAHDLVEPWRLSARRRGTG